MAQNTKKKQGLSSSSIAIIVLSILLLASLAVGVTLAYFTGTATVAGDITLGDPITISITQGGASVSSLTFGDNAMPGSVYNQPIGVTSPANTSNALLRAKLTITSADGATTNVSVSTTDSWVAGDDDYHYYNGVLSANSSVDFVTALTVPTSLTNEAANTSYTINVVVEAIQEANNAANAVWTTAPTTWLNT